MVTTCDENHLNTALAGGGLVTFSGDCTITVTSTKTITANTTIDGGGHHVVLDGGGQVRILRVDGLVVLSLNHLTIQNANSTEDTDGGGAIYVLAGTLIVTNSTFLQNHRDDFGGAIASDGSLYVDGCTFDSNSSGDGGGAIIATGPSSISNSTFYNNTTDGTGALYVESPNVLLTNNTFSNNHGHNFLGGGVHVGLSTVTFKNNIFVNNATNCETSTAIIDGGYNLADDDSCGFTAPTSFSGDGVNAQLSALADNGGPTRTMALQTGSDAIGVIPPGVNGCATTLIADQRGVARPGSLNGACSIGAYEYVPPPDHVITDCSNDAQFHSAWNAGGRMIFHCGSAPITISLQGAAYLPPTQSIMIDGAGSQISLNIRNNELELDGNRVMTINNLTLTGASGSALDANEGTLIVLNSTLFHNGYEEAGPALISNSGTVFASNTTISQNAGSEDQPAAVATNSGALILTNSTIVNNSAAGTIPAIEPNHGSLTLQNTLLANNAGGNCPTNRSVTDLGYNLDDDGTCHFTATGSKSHSQNANVGALSDNGGSTQTIPLGVDSSAVDAIPLGVSGCGLSPDQRGSLRPSGPGCDIGAYEAQEIPVPFDTNPSGLSYIVNNANYSGAQAPFLAVGGQYLISTADPQNLNSTRYAFQNWSDTSVLSHGITIDATNPVNYLATFSLSGYLLSTQANPAAGGMVAPSGSNLYYAPNAVVNLSASGNSGYVFSSWTGGVANTNSAFTTVTMSQPQTVVANFVQAYTLTATANPSTGGGVSVTPAAMNGLYATGTIVNIAVTPGAGYVFSNWTGSNDIANKNSAATTIAMNANESIMANFVAANAATFLPLDMSTQGNWPGVYGGDGYIIANNDANNKTPTYATVNFTGASSYTWIGAGPSSDLRLPLTTPTSGTRIGSTFYSGTSFNIDLNLTGGQHQLALYLLDLDTTTRSEVITLRNADTQTVLDTRTLSNFHNGVWVVWTMSGHVNIQVTNNGGINAVVAGIFFNTLSPRPAAPSVTIYSPAMNQSVTGAITLSANVTAAAGVQNVQFVLDPANNGGTILSPLIPGPGATFTYQWNSATVNNGPHTLRVIGQDNLAQTAQSSVTFNVQNGGTPTASAQFQSPIDTATQGNWVGKYGQDGFWIANDSSSAPPVYAALTFTGASAYTWNSNTSDPRALLTSPAGSPSARIASTYYSNTNFTLDLNLNDNQQHIVAFYLLDYDDGRSQSIQIVDADNPSIVLDSRTVSGFQNGQYLVWKIQGHVKIQFNCTGGLNAVLSGIFFSTVPSGGQQQPPAVTVTAPTASQQVSSVFQLQATATSTGSVSSVQFYVDSNPVGPAITQGVSSTYSYNLDTTTLSNGAHMVKAVATDNLSQPTTSGSVSFNVLNTAAGSNTATFVKTDSTTQGNWKGVYGTAGEIIAGDSNLPPSYAVVNLAGASVFTWTYTSDPRAPLTATSNTTRIASAFYNSPGFSVDVNFTDGKAHPVALYLLDWDGGGRVETIQLVDAASNGVVNTRSVSNFNFGVYLVWNITGHVKILASDNVGANAVISGVFFQ